MRNERGVALWVVIALLVILAILIGTCVYAYRNAPPSGPTVSAITVAATPTALIPGGSTTVVIAVTLSGPAPATGQTVYVRVLEADYFGDDNLYQMLPVFIPPMSPMGNTTVTLDCDSGDRRLRAPLGSGQSDYSDWEAQWDLRVIPYYGSYPQSTDIPLTCPGG